MKPKVMYAAGGGIAVLAVIIFFVIGPASFTRNQLPEGGQSQLLSEAPPIEVALNNVTVTRTGNDTAEVKVEFGVYNPNEGTVSFERITYSVFVDEFRMTSGDIGESPQGFVDSSSDIIYIISYSTVKMKDTEVSERNDRIAESWDKMVAGDSTFVVRGDYSYRHSRGLDTAGDEKTFELTFP